MNARLIGTAIAVVLAMVGCKTAGSQSSSGGSAQSSSTEASTEQQGSQASSAGQEGSQPGTAAQDPLMQPGPAVKGHASDRVVSGAIATVSPFSVSIVSDQGETKTLEIVPETAITVEGTEASSTELEEGQPVRASFNEVDGQEVAVEIQVLPATGGATGSGGSDQDTEPGGSSIGGSSTEPATPTDGNR
jgi:hypothetical protein